MLLNLTIYKHMEFTDLTIIQAAKLLRQGKISSVELTKAHLDGIERLNPSLNAFIATTADAAISHAEKADGILRMSRRASAGASSPLCGVPLALKDLYETAGIPTTAGSLFFKDYLPRNNAAVVQKLYDDGAVLLGKLNMHEIALGVTSVNPHFGACRNPWSLDKVAGGSSGGSAAALASRLCMGSLGSDTGGSIRIPSALCGCVGFKPTYGRVSVRGVIPLSTNLDHAGPMARTAQDAALLLQAIAGWDSSDPFSADVSIDDYVSHINSGIKGLRFALATGPYFFEKTQQEVIDAVDNAAAAMVELGAKCSRIDVPYMGEAAAANGIMIVCDAAVYHEERLAQAPENFGEDVRRRLLNGAAMPVADYVKARHFQTIFRHELISLISNYDFIVMPTCPVTAPPVEGPDALEQARLLTRFTAPFNLAGTPALALPCGYSSDGLPISLQICGPPWSEAKILRAAHAYEEASGWRQRKPALD